MWLFLANFHINLILRFTKSKHFYIDRIKNIFHADSTFCGPHRKGLLGFFNIIHTLHTWVANLHAITLDIHKEEQVQLCTQINGFLESGDFLTHILGSGRGGKQGDIFVVAWFTV